MLVESGIRKICFLLNPESLALESETKLKQSGIHYVLESEIRVVPVFQALRNPKPGIRNPRPGIQNRTLLGILLMGSDKTGFTE